MCQARVARTLLSANAKRRDLQQIDKRNGEEAVEKNREPVSPIRIRRTTRVAGAHSKLANAWIAQHPQRGLREYLRMALGVRNHFSIVVGGREQVSVSKTLSGQQAGGFVKLRRPELGDLRPPPLFPPLLNRPAH